VGRALAQSGLARSEYFVTTKVWNDDHGHEKTLTAFERSLDLLGLEYVDLYLIHWPSPWRGLYPQSWEALVEIKASGRARSIGVSNFAIEHLEELGRVSDVVPSVNQIELHPFLQQRELQAFNTSRGIATEAWSPLARGTSLENPVLQALGAKYDKSAAQVVLRWHLQSNRIVIPKSTRPERIAENFDVFDFELDAADIANIATLESGTRTGADPSTAEF
jgi:2,5-diketo-D-gluconate reductase A